MAASRTTVLSLAVLGAVALIGAAYLPYAFSGDQAFFTLGALRMHEGGALYRDFWDIKQPGIFAFYYIAGTLFGFNEVGIHLFELLYLLIFAVVLQQTLNSRFERPWIAAVTPLLIIGWYYLVAGTNGYTQVEALVGFPLYVSMYCCIRAFQSEHVSGGLLAAAAVAGAIVVAFKLIYLIVLVAVWFAIVFASGRMQREGVRIGILLGTFACAVALLWVWCASLAGAQLLYYTFFTVPSYLVRLPSPPFSRLIHAFTWYAGVAAPLLLLGLVGVWTKWKARDPLVWGCVAWILAAVIAIVIQRQSWWAYQTMLLAVPSGILAAKGLDSIRSLNRVVMAVLVVCALPYAWKYIQEGRMLQRHDFARTTASAQAYREALNPLYVEAREDTGILRSAAAVRGNIYVCGNPLYYLQAGREQATALNGWAPELFMPQQWMTLEQQMQQARPPYVFITNDNEQLIASRASDFSSFIGRQYRVLERTPRGIWYGDRYAAMIWKGKLGSAESVSGSTWAISL
jgi:hypothetical protein